MIVQQGRRISDGELLKSGEYSKTSDGVWIAVTPKGQHCNLRRHTVTVHPDGTISTAEPIEVPDGSWHLNNGVWSEIFHARRDAG